MPWLALTDSRRVGTPEPVPSPSPRALVRAGSAVDDWMTGVLGEEFNARLKRVPLALGTGGVDPFGLDPKWTKWALAAAAALHRHYFRTEVFGANRLPAGRMLLVA